MFAGHGNLYERSNVYTYTPVRNPTGVYYRPPTTFTRFSIHSPHYLTLGARCDGSGEDGPEDAVGGDSGPTVVEEDVLNSGTDGPACGADESDTFDTAGGDYSPSCEFGGRSAAVPPLQNADNSNPALCDPSHLHASGGEFGQYVPSDDDVDDADFDEPSDDDGDTVLEPSDDDDGDTVLEPSDDDDDSILEPSDDDQPASHV
uniref:Uncharacterized protein n=1 Tax=Lygus hesperus TaxID=30085 RepID=A0A0A9XJC0_LYGHE